MKTEFNKLQLFIQDKDKEPIGCGYYYIVTNGSGSHTAFRTKKALNVWLKNTAIKIGKRGYWSGVVHLEGQYTSAMEMLNNDEFFAKHAGQKTYFALCNGAYSIGFIEETPNGNVLYHQNPNTDRFILDYNKVTQHLETGKETRFTYK